jgi:hypothetical protein
MPVVLFVLIKLVVEAIRSALRKTRPVKPQPLSAGCSNAHVQYGAEGRRAISCTVGGMVRPCHVGRVVLHRLPRPQSQDSLSADRVCTGGPGQPSRSVEMLPERLSAPLGEGLRTDGVSGGLPCLGGGLWGHVVPATAGKFPELQVRRVPVLRSYFPSGS